IGHALALEHGRAGERYILGGVDLWLEELFSAIADLAGRPRPRLRVPYWAVRAAATTGFVNRHEARLARLPMFFSSAKAERELGYGAGPVEPALARSVVTALDGAAPVSLSSALATRSDTAASADPAIPSRT